MHELSIAQSLLDIIEQETSLYKNTKVTVIRLRIGRLSGIVPDALRFAFEVISKGGSAEGAYVNIEDVPLKIMCRQCNKSFIADDPYMFCPDCKGLDVEMISGRELEIKEMEINDEEPD